MKYANIEWLGKDPYSPDFDDIYYSDAGSRDEAEYVFLSNNRVPERFQNQESLIVAETGFGFGLNFVLTLLAWRQNAKDGVCFHYIGIEKNPVSPDDIRQLAKNWPDLAEYFDELLIVYPLPVKGHHTRTLFNGRVYLHLIFMDVVDALEHDQFNVDAWYLDGFSPQKNPDLWNDHVFELIAQNSKNDASLSTYTSAGIVKRGLVAAGFSVDKTPGYARKREMIVAVLRNKKTCKTERPWFVTTSPVVKNKSALIIGAGLSGLTCAWALTKRGWNVAVIDKHQSVAQEASGNPAGLVLPRLSIDNEIDSMFYTNALLYATSQLDILQKTSNEEFWFKEGVYSLLPKGKAKKIINKNDFSDAFIDLLENDDMPQSLRSFDGDVLYFKEAGWAIPYKICEAITRAIEDDINIISTEVCDLVMEQDQWAAKDQHGKTIESADIAIIANGVSANKFEVTSWLDIASARGQITKISASDKSDKLKSAMSFDGYVTPEHNGVHITGASYNIGDTNKKLTEEDQSENLARLNRYFPDVFLQPGNLDGRVGFRAVSDDRVPVVGPVPDRQAFIRIYSDLHHGRPAEQYAEGEYRQGLYITAAHGSRGMCSCFLSAEIIASMAEGDLLPVSKTVSDYINPARFIIRQLKRHQMIS